MKTSSRPREIGGSFAARRGHAAQLSISDSNHHVTEAIGDMYGDDDYSKRDSRPLSFIVSPNQDTVEDGISYLEPSSRRARPSPLIGGPHSPKAHTSPAIMQSPRNGGFEGSSLSPSLSLRESSSSETANAQFPLTDIDYESSPSAVAQELSNLQALRRMSMDVGSTGDPDLPSFSGASLIPSAAPTGNDDEDDPSRLFWVPARVHPELAPMEFKTFLENRVQTIKRRSGEQTGLSPDGLEAGSGSLRRKKSMLSRQIDNSGGRGGVGYKDGSEQLERKKSLSGEGTSEIKISDLQDLDALVRDPAKVMRKMSIDLSDSIPEDEDMPILPQVPGAVGLRRSTHTSYRKGSLRRGERVPFSKRAGSLRTSENDGDETSSPPPGESFTLNRVQTEPAVAENFSRPNRRNRRGIRMDQTNPSPSIPDNTQDNGPGWNEENLSRSSLEEGPTQPQPGSLKKSSTFPIKPSSTNIPQIIVEPSSAIEETPEAPISQHSHSFPERQSSTVQLQLQQRESTAPPPEPPARSSRRPTIDRVQISQPQAQPQPPSQPQTQPQPQPQSPSQQQNYQQQQQQQPAAKLQNHSLSDITQYPTPLPGSNVRTDTLTFIPTAIEEKKPEKKSRKDKDDSEHSGSRKPSWGWFKGSDEKDKKEKKKDEESKRVKGKVSLDKTHDTTRLDVLNTTMDPSPSRGRESLVMERESMDSRLQEERKKESSRKSGESKKERDGLFSSFFGGGKKKSDRDSGGKKASSLRTLSPDPTFRELKPDIDYNWTRFSILEERAIYRMAHIKLANPRRALYSQVLLSNFMYAYLAKVQQMHPQMQIPQSAQQKRQQEEERRQKEQDEQYQQQQAQHGDPVDHYRYDYHQGIADYAEEQESSHEAEGVTYVDDSQIYDYDHQEHPEDASHRQGSVRPDSRAAQHGNNGGYNDQDMHYERHGSDYYQYEHTNGHDHEADDDDMW